jgi:hypothetical protein
VAGRVFRVEHVLRGHGEEGEHGGDRVGGRWIQVGCLQRLLAEQR